MDIWGALVFFFLVFLIMSCCGYCCTSKRRGAVLATPVVVTSATHTAPGGYPVTQMPINASSYQTNMYASPYPPQMPASSMQMPMPMPMQGATYPPPAGMHPHMAPYPPMAAHGSGYSNANMNPPSYDTVVQQNNLPYEKQSAYNPSFTAH